MRLSKNHWMSLITAPIIGYDEGAGASSPDAGQGTAEGSSGEGTGQQGTSGEGNSTASKTYSEDEISGLKSALEKERNDRKALDKELAAFRKAQKAKEDSEKSEVQRLADDNASLGDRYTKLATQFRNNEVNRVITEAAKSIGFLDPSDALRAEVLDNLEINQDEDDPTKVTVDVTEVVKRVKQLAKAKPHYVGGSQQQAPSTRSGSTFSGASNTGRNDSTAEQQRLAQLYPALRF
jgi:hypothetical protein